MDREAAVALCREKCLKETTVRHLISAEGVMRGLARRFEQDEDLWGLTGMFHDLDQDHTGDDAANHARMTALRAAKVADIEVPDVAVDHEDGAELLVIG